MPSLIGALQRGQFMGSDPPLQAAMIADLRSVSETVDGLVPAVGGSRLCDDLSLREDGFSYGTRCRQ